MLDSIQGVDAQLKKIGTNECRDWSQKIFSKHRTIDGFLKKQYIKDARKSGYVAANQHLYQVDKQLNFSGETSAVLFDEEIENIASIRAIQSKGIYQSKGKDGDIFSMSECLTDFCRDNGVDFPIKFTRNDTEETKTGKIISAAERVSDAKWWRRALRKLMCRQTEGVLRSLGFVKKEVSPYISNWAYKRWVFANARNRKVLSRLEAVTHDDNGNEIVCDLLEKVDASLANPEIREHELVVRMKGYEEIAKGLGLSGVMLTLTGPSRCHPYQVYGAYNKNFDGSSPRDVMDYLSNVWAKIRAEWARNGIKAIGLRTVEPHHDGTPHMHFALFLHPSEKQKAWDIFYRYALEDSPDEPGAKEHRATKIDIDPDKGSMMGYLVKYISKNLTGGGIDWDLEAGIDSQDGAMRATAWASVWGIRQFQVLGSVSVTVWRELRRNREPFVDEDCELLEELRQAADRSDWQEFVELMGGAFVGRADQPLRPEYSPENESVQSRYCEPVKRLIGLWLKPVATSLGRYIKTRDKVWLIREKRQSFEVEAKPPPLDLCQ